MVPPIALQRLGFFTIKRRDKKPRLSDISLILFSRTLTTGRYIKNNHNLSGAMAKI